MTAVVVEDNEPSFILVQEILRSIGWEALQVDRAAYMQEILDRVTPNLIIMDISLPDGDGIELTKQIRDDGIKVPIVVMSSYASPEIRNKAMVAGACACYPKPFSLKELEQIITSIVSLCSSATKSATNAQII